MSKSPLPAVPCGGGALPSLQRLIDDAEPGALLELTPGDYGPARLTRPVILDGNNASVWDDGNSPALHLASTGLCVQNLRVRGRLECLPASGAPPQLSSVRVQGMIQGLSTADNFWELPRIIDLGSISAPVAQVRCEVSAGENCQIISRVSGISAVPSVLPAGVHELRFEARDLMADSLLVGDVEFVCAGITRVVPLKGRVMPVGVVAATSPQPVFSVSSAMRAIWRQKQLTPPASKSPEPQGPTRPASTASQPTKPRTPVSPAGSVGRITHVNPAITKLSAIFDAGNEEVEADTSPQVNTPVIAVYCSRLPEKLTAPRPKLATQRESEANAPGLSNIFDEPEEKS